MEILGGKARVKKKINDGLPDSELLRLKLLLTESLGKLDKYKNLRNRFFELEVD